jgi:hypothetical protein
LISATTLGFIVSVQVLFAPELVSAAVGGRAGNLNRLRMVRIRLRDRTNRDAVLLQILLDVGRVTVGGDTHGLIDHDLKDQVRPAPKVEPQMNAVENRLLKSRSAQTVRNSNDPNYKEDQDGEDRDGFCGEILTHEFLVRW